MCRYKTLPAVDKSASGSMEKSCLIADVSHLELASRPKYFA